jgi:hypothetical protein
MKVLRRREKTFLKESGYLQLRCDAPRFLLRPACSISENPNSGLPRVA